MIAGVLGLVLQAASPTATHDLGFLTAQALADRCESNDPADISYCYAFVTGVHDAMRAYEVWLNLKEFCPYTDLMQGDLRRILLGYLTAYPEMASGQAASTVVVALKAAFPCSVTLSPEPDQNAAPAR